MMKRFRLTKEGRRFLLAVILIGVASLNTGNNLVYLIFSLMLSLSILSLVLPVLNLRSLECAVAIQEPVYAKTPFGIDVEIRNTGKVPSYSVFLDLPEGKPSGLYFPVIERGTTRRTFQDVTVGKRGRYALRLTRLRTGFPFIFLYAHRSLSLRRELIVYPEIIDLSHKMADLDAGSIDRDSVRIDHEGDFFSAREYLYGDESRKIDWKSTAKMQKTMIKEYTRKENRLATVILDNGMSENEESFERAVSAAASLCAEFINREYHVRLLTCGKMIPFGQGRIHLLKILDILSEITMLDMAECSVHEAIEGISMLVISSDSPGFAHIAPLCRGVIDARDL